jgi:hypothetical protein
VNETLKKLYITAVLEAVQKAVASHIDQRLLSSGCRLVRRGTSIRAAEYITRRWTTESVIAFYTLAKANTFMPKSEVVAAAEWRSSALDPFWSRLRNVSVPVVQGDGAEVQMRLFRRGRELVFSAKGIFLKLNVGPLAFDLARVATDTTLGAKIAYDENYSGAANAQESDESRSDEERLHASRTLAEQTQDRAVVGPQTEMFRKASGA